MKKALLILSAVFTLATSSIDAQTTHPISTATISSGPVESKAEIVFTEPVMEEVSITVKDLTGKVMYQAKACQGGEECYTIALDLESLMRGIYILQISGSSGKVKTLKFQKA